MDEVVKEFLTESREGLDQLDADLVVLEKNPDDRDVLARVFRTIHTIKGTCGFLGFIQLEKVSHAGESLLALLRDGELQLSKEIASGLLAMVDAVRTLLERIEYTGLDGADYSELVEELIRLQKGDGETAASVSQTSQTDTEQTTAPAEVSAVTDEMAEVLREFLEESNEGLDRLDSELVDLEQDPNNRTILASIFRTIHTIKGTCGFLGFTRLEKVAHAGENLLALLRDGSLNLNEEITSALLSMVDAVRNLLNEIQRSGRDGEESYDDLVATLTRLKEGATAAQVSEKPAIVPRTDKESTAKSTSRSQGSMGEILIDKHGVSPEHVVEALALQDGGDPRTLGEILVKKGAVASKAVTEALNQQREAKSTGAAENSIRVSVTLLDKLMNLVGELVLARNQIIDYASFHENPQLSAIAQRLNLLTSDLQEGVMQTRMQPIHNIWAKLPRVVRDLAISCGKKIRVEMEGKETELDKSLIEAMKDPLTHLVRNAVDHGIELPAVRREAGKPEEGCLLLRAYHEGGHVHIEISEDGAGIKPDKILAKALEKGLIAPDQAARMSEREICELIFMPGLSTAEKVTNISGRGVGMDVVKTNIEKISGTIELESNVGRGTAFKIKLPLTLAIVPALIVTSGDERFAIPQINVLELIRLSEERQDLAIEYIHDTPVYRLRGKLLPVVYLNRELRLRHSDSFSTRMVVLQAEQHHFGLIVDQINDTQEIVIKPLAEVLKAIPVFAGATIMGDGRVALILDTIGLAQRARVFSARRKHTTSTETPESQEHIAEKQILLVVRSPGNGRLAIPLSRVARLEEFDSSRVESAGNTDVIQYRDQILPLIRLEDVLSERRNAGRLARDEANVAKPDLLQVVVFGRNGRALGLVVDEFIDVSEEVLKIKGQASRGGILGTTVIQNRVTELFDVDAFLSKAMTLWVGVTEA